MALALVEFQEYLISSSYQLLVGREAIVRRGSATQNFFDDLLPLSQGERVELFKQFFGAVTHGDILSHHDVQNVNASAKSSSCSSGLGADYYYGGVTLTDDIPSPVSRLYGPSVL
ncbi:MAG: hypothetical protein HY644_14620 [Acidobacteria bacterium]|nr:hypothetical protein [Acidobacteriota bacterium]